MRSNPKIIKMRIDGREVRLVPLNCRALEEAGIPFSPNTLRAWARKGKYPSVFTKVGGRVYVKLEEWQRVMKDAVLGR